MKGTPFNVNKWTPWQGELAGQPPLRFDSLSGTGEGGKGGGGGREGSLSDRC